jgi:hypothetical protein
LGRDRRGLRPACHHREDARDHYPVFHSCLSVFIRG